jgi:hypothetical protein
MENSNSKAFLHTLGAAAWVPLAQALITGALVTLVLILFTASLNVRGWFTWSAGGGLVTVVGVWIYSMRHWFNLTKLEMWTGLDLNQDGNIGDAPPVPSSEPQFVKVTLNRISTDGHFSGEYFDLPGTMAQLKMLADGLLNGVPFTTREWTGDKKPYSSDGFQKLRKEMLRRGLVELASEKDSRQGYVLTDEGSQFMANILENNKKGE